MNKWTGQWFKSKIALCTLKCATFIVQGGTGGLIKKNKGTSTQADKLIFSLFDLLVAAKIN